MKKVNLELTSEQYKELLRLMYAGLWLLKEPDNIPMNDLLQEVFAKATEAGHKKLTDYDENLQLFNFSEEFDEEMFENIEYYEEESFWNNLIFKLSERDAAKIYGGNLQEIDIEEAVELIQPISDKYFKEFEKNGLDNIVVKGI